VGIAPFWPNLASHDRWIRVRMRQKQTRLFAGALAALHLVVTVLMSAGIPFRAAVEAKSAGEITLTVPICHKSGDRRTVEIKIPVSGASADGTNVDTGNSDSGNSDAGEGNSEGPASCAICSVYCGAVAVPVADDATIVLRSDPLPATRALRDHAPPTRRVSPWFARGPPAAVKLETEHA